MTSPAPFTPGQRQILERWLDGGGIVPRYSILALLAAHDALAERVRELEQEACNFHRRGSS